MVKSLLVFFHTFLRLLLPFLFVSLKTLLKSRIIEIVEFLFIILTLDLIVHIMVFIEPLLL